MSTEEDSVPCYKISVPDAGIKHSVEDFNFLVQEEILPESIQSTIMAENDNTLFTENQSNCDSHLQNGHSSNEGPPKKKIKNNVKSVKKRLSKTCIEDAKTLQVQLLEEQQKQIQFREIMGLKKQFDEII